MCNASIMGAIKEVRGYITGTVPRDRIGQGNDIGQAAVSLAFEEPNFITGVELFVDGGLNAS